MITADPPTNPPQLASDVEFPAPLRPSELDPLAEQAANALRREGESSNTVASYRSALRYWAAWHGLRYRQPIRLPLAPAVVVQFIVDHATRQTPHGPVCELPPAIDQALVADGYKARPGAPALSTLTHRLAVLARAHRLQQLPNPCADASVRELMSGIRRAYARRGQRQARKAALTRDPLLRLLATCDDSLRGVRDRALLLFAWASGGRRRSEVARATVENLTRVAPGEFVYVLGWSKTNQSGRDHADAAKPVTGAAGQALEAWLAASGIAGGPLFRRIRRGGHVGEGLSDAAVSRIVKARCVQAGLEGDYSAHSLRAGFVTEAAAQQVPLAETMAMTGHASVATVVRYFRAADMQRSRAADLLGPAQAEGQNG
ncbi:site-specific integrase [Cupriavidus oxalaticus]|uniref:Phage integrase n=1 Tax=Cupriavidus oxalaticus TaxID=96344 RepID=A0A375GQL4_9BURK|nr:site-specific integrase [Cupriavidus oxalaticus]QRQ83546.1 site-specific integrase [Cupriavidus oxalaticus]QRQ92365.1 site-specific integrase [Cupriavidus oxalaticus]WQD86980.1 site-specific integrase [Cupriavidus oxalaticus]SPC24660.1 Phage integrase [Cupriavidus oxalaticus]